MPIENLTSAEKFVWKWRNNKLSEFKSALLHAIQHADVQNLKNLRLGFPDEVEGFVSYRLIPGWWDTVEDKMSREFEEHLCKSCARNKHGCLENAARYTEITECDNHEPKGASDGV